MKNTLLLISAFFAFMLCNAQVKTHSNYDVDGDGNVTISDVTKTANKVIEKVSDERMVVDGENLNALLVRLEQKLDALSKKHERLQREHELIMEHFNIHDPYNGHEYVDLGLPSGLKWATCNVGAKSAEEYGDYFAWGETEPYYTEGHSQDSPCSNWKEGKSDGYEWTSYKWCSNGDWSGMTKYTYPEGKTDGKWYNGGSFIGDYKTVLESADDAATVNWGSPWRMPTKEEQEELVNNCTWTWTTLNGAEGYHVIGPNGNSIFLPRAGGRVYDYISNVGEQHRIFGYWSSSLSILNSDEAFCIYSSVSLIAINDSWRRSGFPVRPVCP